MGGGPPAGAAAEGAVRGEAGLPHMRMCERRTHGRGWGRGRLPAGARRSLTWEARVGRPCAAHVHLDRGEALEGAHEGVGALRVEALAAPRGRVHLRQELRRHGSRRDGAPDVPLGLALGLGLAQHLGVHELLLLVVVLLRQCLQGRVRVRGRLLGLELLQARQELLPLRVRLRLSLGLRLGLRVGMGVRVGVRGRPSLQHGLVGHLQLREHGRQRQGVVARGHLLLRLVEGLQVVLDGLREEGDVGVRRVRQEHTGEQHTPTPSCSAALTCWGTVGFAAPGMGPGMPTPIPALPGNGARGAPPPGGRPMLRAPGPWGRPCDGTGMPPGMARVGEPLGWDGGRRPSCWRAATSPGMDRGGWAVAGVCWPDTTDCVAALRMRSRSVEASGRSPTAGLRPLLCCASMRRISSRVASCIEDDRASLAADEAGGAWPALPASIRDSCCCWSCCWVREGRPWTAPCDPFSAPLASCIDRWNSDRMLCGGEGGKRT